MLTASAVAPWPVGWRVRGPRAASVGPLVSEALEASGEPEDGDLVGPSHVDFSAPTTAERVAGHHVGDGNFRLVVLTT